MGTPSATAVAAAFANERPGQVYAVIQSEAAEDVLAAAGSVGLEPIEVASRGDTGATVAIVQERLRVWPNAVVAVTGGSELVVAVRAALRSEGVKNIKTKAYWIPGKTGLD